MECVQVIEDRQSLTVTSQYVWRLAHIDGLVLRDDNSSGGNLGISGSGLGRRLYAQQDGNWNLKALVDTGGAVRERFVYDPYGNVQALDAGGNSASDGYGWAYLHQGGRLEPATGLYYFRHRDYSPGMGRWVEEDPIGYGDGMNLYQYLGSDPPIYRDPRGLMRDPMNVPTAILVLLEQGFTVEQLVAMGLISATTGSVLIAEMQGKNPFDPLSQAAKRLLDNAARCRLARPGAPPPNRCNVLNAAIAAAEANVANLAGALAQDEYALGLHPNDRLIASLVVADEQRLAAAQATLDELNAAKKALGC